jgi:hypothetical protein
MVNRKDDVETALDELNAEYDGDLAALLGADWRDTLRPHFQSVWYFGYTTGHADSAKIDRLAAEAAERQNP